MANEKIFTIKINGVEKSYNDVVKLRDLLKELSDIEAKVKVETDKVNKSNEQSSKTSKEKAKALSEEEKAAKKLAETQDKASHVITQIERDQAAANLQLRERTRHLQLQVQAENAATNSIESMRIELAKLKSEWKKLDVDSVEFVELSKTIDELNEKIKQHEQATGDFRRNVGNYESATKGLEQTLQGLGEGINQTAEHTKGLLNMFQAGAGALVLFGGESDTTQKMLSDLGKVLAVVSALQAANNALLSKGAIASKFASVMEGVHSVQVRARALSISLANKNTVTAIALQKALNLAQKASPLLWLLGAFVAIVGGITAYNAATADATEQTKKYTSSLDGVSFATEEARDAHDEHLKRIRDLQIEYRVLTGNLTNYQAELLKIANSTEDQLNKIAEDNNKKKLDIEDQYKSKWYNFIDVMVDGGRKKADALTALENETATKRATILDEKGNLILIAQKKHNDERVDLQDKLTSELKTGLDKELFDLQVQRNKALDEAQEKGVESNRVYEVYAKKESELIDKYDKQKAEKAKQATEKARQNVEKQKELIKSLQQFQDETSKLDQQNVLNRITTNRELLKSVEELTGSYQDQKAILIEQSNDTIKTVSTQYDELIKKAQEAGVDISKLTEVKNERIKALEVQLSNELLSLENERVEKVKEINEKAVQNRQQLIGLEMAQLDTFYNSIESRLDQLEVKSSEGIINVDATRKNIEEANKNLSEYLTYLQNAKNKIEQYYNETLSHYDKDSLEYKQLLLDKQNALLGFQKQEASINKEISDNTQKETQLQADHWQQVAQKIQYYIDAVMNGVTAVFDGVNSILQAQLDDANEKYDAISQKYDDVVTKREESDSRIQELEEQAQTARGGRALALQEQINSEMEANKQLADQEKRLANEKEKQEKEIAKKERQMKKAQIASDIVSGMAGTALAVINAMQVKPFPLGVVLASVAGAMGAVQVGVMTNQLTKLEKGGLLKGKRHAQGGMRVEGTNIEVEGGEYVVNKESTNKNIGLIRYINKQKRTLTPTDLNTFFSKSAQSLDAPFKRMFETGGQLPSITNSSNTNIELIADAIRSVKIESKVSVADINKVQDELSIVDNWTGL